MSGMRRADNLSEWQLQAVLFKAKLTQYFETFISQVLLLIKLLQVISKKCLFNDNG